MRHGETVAIRDVRLDPRIPKEAYAPTFVRSLVMVPIDFVVQTVGLLVHRARAASAIRISEERLRLAVDHADVGFWDVDFVQNTLVWPSQTKAMFGVSADVPVTLQDFYDGLHPEDRDAMIEAFTAAADP
ncbi:hypothetical protein SAMN05216605_10992 [Pseudomonas abietaniphila]|uniref:PAS domain-containing protein n=2 Tax=Pseudomonas abietaniphila TaxID=89065 RepID=A0A1G8GCK3_9PSED|nr:hypothetical protein [Pseudomonas abietaniphila]SDH92105.1 hypothetical protein SAMN05216605_10992 [Pseudomonas abietaniphila]